MAGDWLKVECGLPEKAEVWDIAMTLGVDPDLVVGKLVKVWRWFDQHTESGNAPRVTYSLLDNVAGLTGFAEAMTFAGWLVVEGRDMRLPNFDRHNGKTAKNRALTAKRVAEHKAKTGNAKVTQTPLPREEKRREEKDQKQELPPSSPVKKATKGTRLPVDWTPSAELVAQVDEIGGPSLWRHELPRFRDYWAGRSGSGATKLDWPATFRNWIRKAADDQRARSPANRPQQPSRQARQLQAIEDVINDPAYHATAQRQLASDRDWPGASAPDDAQPSLDASTRRVAWHDDGVD